MSPLINKDPYPSTLKHGDILLPRPPGVTAITSPVERLQADWQSSYQHPQPRDHLNPDGSVDLVRYWPTLLLYLRRVAGEDPACSMSIQELLKQVDKDLHGALNPEDLKRAILAKQYVGHCAVVDRPADDGETWVIESSHTHGGLRSVAYAEWLQEREALGAHVWQYRLFALDDGQAEVGGWRQAFVEAAHRYRMQGVRYAIFDGRDSGAKFSLDNKDVNPAGDPTCLYCSELVLRCALDVLGVDLKERAEEFGGGLSAQSRDFNMFTPKDITWSKHGHYVNMPGGKQFFIPTTMGQAGTVQTGR